MFQIYLETLSLQRENVPKLPACVLRLLLRKTGLWPVHDIKSFAIGAFLTSLLLTEQMINKKPCASQYQVQTRSQTKR